MARRAYLGVDVGSVSTNLVLMDEQGEVLEKVYLRTKGEPIAAIQEGMRMLAPTASETEIAGVGTTGSGRRLAGVIVGADCVKNEITAHAVASAHVVPEVRTVIEIGGQDSKIIILREGAVIDFAMNTVCAAGTGSFLDQQAARLGVPIERFGELALMSKTPVRIAGRCAVFAESDMIHKQQMGHRIEDIVAGLCEALVRNYLNNVGKGKDIQPPIVFQGGVAANVGMKAAFEKALGTPVTVPEHYNVMGAIGAALLAAEEVERRGGPSNFRGFHALDMDYAASTFECKGCPNLCEVVNIRMGHEVIARWGSRCGRWDSF
ncbi:MAG: 2-hydroxyglutaryl-CoA dehydratase [Firmicutes bacterium]|nr:2-hydroxyglutaryl-CoA dehydratase [Bacillota bacterium]HHY33614.1 2-hydroxyglutaryl-CoA dehydratase [Bacillota bacterium]